MNPLKLFFPYLWHYFTDDYKDRLHHLVVDTILSFLMLLLMGGNILLAGWLYLYSITPAVTTSVTASDMVISGETMTFNGSLVPTNKTINKVDLKFVLPTSFTTNDPLSYHYDLLKKGDEKKLAVSGRFVGAVKKTYRGILLYSYQYYGQTYSGNTTTDFKVDTTSLEITTDMPDHILNDETFTWKIDYHNSSQVERQDTCIRLDIPESFKVESTSQPMTDNKIMFTSIPAQSGGSVDVIGSFSNAQGEGSHVLGILGMDDCATGGFEQVALQQPVDVIAPRLTLTTYGSAMANIGDTVTYYVVYHNVGDTALENIVTTVDLSNGTTKQWTDGSLAAGDTRTKAFTMSVSSGTRTKNLTQSYSVSATGTIAGVNIPIYTKSLSYQTKYNSTLNFSQVARYDLGYGPHPMRAWDVSAVRVFWQVEDFTNDLSNVTIQTTLPTQVEWTGLSAVTEGGAMAYNPATRVVTWHTSSIPSFAHAQGCSFEVRVIPNSAQVGKNINITNEVKFTARDGFTDAVLTRVLGALRTDQPIQAAR
ncbi:MAG: hypothetical protein WCV88_04180 [Patescibacteria group bacterium]|jgi:uncharacterized repeat protein (TIGR01451 family)